MIIHIVAWSALSKLGKIWRSDLREEMKVKVFRAAVETVLLYGSETWILTKAASRKIDGAYTKILRVVKGITWQDKVPNEKLHSKLPRITTAKNERLHRFSRHCHRSKNKIAHKVILWERSHGKRSAGRPQRPYIDQLEQDTGIPRINLVP